MYIEIKTSIFPKKVFAVQVDILIHSDCFLGLPPPSLNKQIIEKKITTK